MLKKDYNKLVEGVREMLKQRDANMTEEYTPKGEITTGGYKFIITTPCGKLNVTIWNHKSKNKSEWLFTRLDNPELANERVLEHKRFNKFCGKYNEYSEHYTWLLGWLEEYLDDLFWSS